MPVVRRRAVPETEAPSRAGVVRRSKPVEEAAAPPPFKIVKRSDVGIDFQYSLELQTAAGHWVVRMLSDQPATLKESWEFLSKAKHVVRVVDNWA